MTNSVMKIYSVGWFCGIDYKPIEITVVSSDVMDVRRFIDTHVKYEMRIEPHSRSPDNLMGRDSLAISLIGMSPTVEMSQGTMVVHPINFFGVDHEPLESSNTELMCCPFCGENAVLEVNEDSDSGGIIHQAWVECEECEASTSFSHNTSGDKKGSESVVTAAIAEWNKRYQPSGK